MQHSRENGRTKVWRRRCVKWTDCSVTDPAASTRPAIPICQMSMILKIVRSVRIIRDVRRINIVAPCYAPIDGQAREFPRSLRVGSFGARSLVSSKAHHASLKLLNKSKSGAPPPSNDKARAVVHRNGLGCRHAWVFGRRVEIGDCAIEVPEVRCVYPAPQPIAACCTASPDLDTRIPGTHTLIHIS